MTYISKTRKQKLEEYEMKYGHIPKDDKERINWLVDKYNLSSSKMDQIIEKKRWIESSLRYYDYKIILYEDPEGAKRPRVRLVNRSNFNKLAMGSSNFIHVYSPNAADDHRYIHRLIDQELIALDQFIQTPMMVNICTYQKIPSSFNQADTILAEIGIHRPISKPDWDNFGKKYPDMFNANIWLDDQLVQDGEVHKYFSILPRVEIFIRYLNYYTNQYQYNQIINRKDYNCNYPIQYLNSFGRPNEL